MSISRRGLIAAGLAVAVVGAVGVASTLNAGAAQIAEPTNATADSAAVAARKPDPRKGLLSPPPNLPGGGKAAVVGKSERSSQSVQSDGSEAVTEPPLEVEPVYGPKSLPGYTVPKSKRGSKRSVPAMRSDVAPPAPPAVAARAAAAADPAPRWEYYYSHATQIAETNGVYGYMPIEAPTLAEGETHTLAEVAVRSLDGPAVEVGWTRDRDTFDDDQPRLFVYQWNSSVEPCYNKCGWTQYSPRTGPGKILTEAAAERDPDGNKIARRFSIQHSGNAWWIGYESEWIGYFADSIWGGKFTKGSAVQWFGEVAVPNGKKPCSLMGSGAPGSKKGVKDGEEDTTSKATTFTRMGLYPAVPAVAFGTFDTNAKFYSGDVLRDDKEIIIPNTFRFGGPGAC